MAAATRWAGPDAVVAGRSAAFLHGFDAADPTPVHLMVPYGNRRRTRPGVAVHNGPSLAADTVWLAGLPVLDVERVVVDVLCTAGPASALAVADQAMAAVAAAAREAFRARLGERIRRRPDPRGTRIAATLLDLATGQAESPAESWLLWALVDLGFPVPEVNHWVCNLDGTPVFRVDLCWPALRIAVEYYGHVAHVDQVEKDAVRVGELERRGWIVVVVTAADLGSVTRMERELQEAFLARGLNLRDRARRALRPRRHRERWVG
ncbi:MAG: hypothetical protein BGP03_26275 [Pseudonocardia sp. 73-21]|nr:MAG: hypothetical protein BGP03_26275 [Pseudonocardia sp. 73-21]